MNRKAKIFDYFLFGYFSFQPSKNNAVLEPRTGHFRGLVGSGVGGGGSGGH